MDFFTGKHALITGGSSGIGLALAKALAAHGARVTILARRPEQLQQAAEAIRACCGGSGQPVETISADIAAREPVQAAVREYIQRAGAPDFLINSAGITHPAMFTDTPPEIFDQIMAVNFHGTVNVIQAALPAMLQRGSGHITILSSGAGFLGLVGYSAYGASKFALRGLADVLRVELKPQGIGVSLVAPGDTQTPQLEYENQFKPEATRLLVGNNSNVQSPEHVAEVILSGIRRGKYIITPGAEITLYYLLTNTAGLVYPVMDMMMRPIWKKVRAAKHDGHHSDQA